MTYPQNNVYDRNHAQKGVRHFPRKPPLPQKACAHLHGYTCQNKLARARIGLFPESMYLSSLSVRFGCAFWADCGLGQANLAQPAVKEGRFPTNKCTFLFGDAHIQCGDLRLHPPLCTRRKAQGQLPTHLTTSPSFTRPTSFQQHGPSQADPI